MIDDAGAPHLAWQMWVDDNGWRPDTVRYARWEGGQWLPDTDGVVVHTPSGDFNPPEIAVESDGNVLLTFIDTQGVWLSVSDDKGDSFASPVQLADDPATIGDLANDLATAPVVLASGSMHVVYENDQGTLIHLSDVDPLLASDDAAFVVQVIPQLVDPGGSFQVSVTMRNTGTTTWSAADGYALGSQAPDDNTTWGLSRIDLPSGTSVPPASTWSFAAMAVAPSAPGSHAMQWRMNRASAGWFGATTDSVAIQLGGAGSDGGIADGSIADALGPDGANSAEAGKELPIPVTEGESSSNCACCAARARPSWHGLLAIAALAWLPWARRRRCDTRRAGSVHG